MKLGFFERLYINSPLRTAVARPLEFRLFRRLVPIPAQAHILEIGCGNGSGLHWLATHANPASVTGVDLDFSQVIRARQRLSTLKIPYNVLPADAAAIPLPAHGYDIAISTGCLARMPGWQEALTECIRLLRPGGLLYVRESPRRFTQTQLTEALAGLGCKPLGSQAPMPGLTPLSVYRLATTEPAYD